MLDFPNLSIRYSEKAKRLALRQTPHVLELVIPKRSRISQKTIRQFVQDHHGWIAQAEQRILTNKAFRNNIVQLPEHCAFPAFNQEICLRRESFENHMRLSIEQHPTERIDQYSYRDEDDLKYNLRSWLIEQARYYILPRLSELAEKYQISYHSGHIKLNKRQWGSCSIHKKINLCAKLLFLPKPLLEHVLLHELTHLRHFDHSSAFWNHLQLLDPQTNMHREALKQADLQLRHHPLLCFLTAPTTENLAIPLEMG